MPSDTSSGIFLLLIMAVAINIPTPKTRNSYTSKFATKNTITIDQCHIEDKLTAPPALKLLTLLTIGAPLSYLLQVTAILIDYITLLTDCQWRLRYFLALFRDNICCNHEDDRKASHHCHFRKNRKQSLSIKLLNLHNTIIRIDIIIAWQNMREG